LYEVLSFNIARILRFRSHKPMLAAPKGNSNVVLRPVLRRPGWHCTGAVITITSSRTLGCRYASIFSTKYNRPGFGKRQPYHLYSSRAEITRVFRFEISTKSTSVVCQTSLTRTPSSKSASSYSIVHPCINTCLVFRELHPLLPMM